MKKFVAGPSITLIVALVVLFASLAALLLANSLRAELQKTRGQLEQAQSELQKTQEAKNPQQKTDKADAKPAEKQPGTVNKSQQQDSTKDRPQDPKTPATPAPAGQGQKEQQ